MSRLPKPAMNKSAWEQMYEKREKELKGEVVRDPKKTLQEMYDKIVTPVLARKGDKLAQVPLPFDVDQRGAEKDASKASGKQKEVARKKAKKSKKKQKEKKTSKNAAKSGKKRQKTPSSSSSSSSSDSDSSTSSSGSVQKAGKLKKKEKKLLMLQAKLNKEQSKLQKLRN
eukprot:TRINITY_DN32745_c0_g1_i1.p2 TRINITY_DN32745_c0_g1~~TRINITY_DN32745_c0_g1_i1.p2  ORF type:complete len:170 (-),score=44.35 TRINITY_DN32745_c0_g1_i1:195-704(-)